MKKFVSTLLAATMLGGLLVGCDSTKSSTPAPAPASSSSEKITAKIKVWTPSEDQSPDSGEWLQNMCKAFNDANPNWDITFDYGVCSEGETGNTISSDPSAAADVYMFANDQIPKLLSSNAIAKIGGDTANYVKETNSETIVKSVTSNGSIYGVPFTTNTWFMYYDTSKFSEEDIKSLDTMLTKNKVAFPLSVAWWNASFFIANGCEMFGPDGTDNDAGIQFGGDKGLEVVEYLVDLVANPNFLNDADGAGIAGLRDGSVAAIFSGSWDYNSVKEALGDNFGAAALPTVNIGGSEKQLKSFSGSKAIGVNPNSKYPQIAVALAKYLGSAEAQKSHFELRAVVPCNTELLQDAQILENPMVKAQNETFDRTSIIQPFVPAMDNYWSPAGDFGKAIINKEITKANAKEKLEAFVKALNTSLID